jgi:hypothetical protein
MPAGTKRKLLAKEDDDEMSPGLSDGPSESECDEDVGSEEESGSRRGHKTQKPERPSLQNLPKGCGQSGTTSRAGSVKTSLEGSPRSHMRTQERLQAKMPPPLLTPNRRKRASLGDVSHIHCEHCGLSYQDHRFVVGPY